MGYVNNYIVPTAFTFLLHVMVLFFVVVGWQMSDSKRYKVDTPRYVKARLVSLEQKQPKPIKKQASRQVKKTAPPRSKPVQKTSAQSSSKAPVIPVPVAGAKPESAPVPEPKPETPPQPDPEQERQRERESARQQQQADFQRAMEEEEYMMQVEEDQLQAEEDELQADSYAALIKRRVEGYWSRPPSARKNMQVELSIRLVPTGEVVGVEVLKSSGNSAFDRSAIIAVEKAARFPELKDMSPTVFEAYFRRFTLLFKPEDLLL